MNAADAITTAAAEIVTRTGCTVDAALTYLVNNMSDEMLAKFILAGAEKMGA